MTRDSWFAIYAGYPPEHPIHHGENNMNAVTTLVEQRDALRRKADGLDRSSDKAAIEGDRQYEISANVAAEAHEVREEIKKYNVAIGALGGEPKQGRRAALAAKVKAAPAKKA